MKIPLSRENAPFYTNKYQFIKSWRARSARLIFKAKCNGSAQCAAASQVFAHSVNSDQRHGAHDHRDRTRFFEIDSHERNQEIDAISIRSCLCFCKWFVVSARGSDCVQVVHGYVRFSAPAKLQSWHRVVRAAYTQRALQLYTPLRVCIFDRYGVSAGVGAGVGA